MTFVIWGDLWFSLELHNANTKDILSSIQIHCWPGSGDPASSASLSSKPLVHSGPCGGCAPVRIFPAALSCDLWDWGTWGKGS